MAYTMKHIGDKIKKCRKEYGLTQEQLAEIIDIAPNYLSQIENGKRGINITNLIKIANSLNITFDYLLSDENAPAIETENDYHSVWMALLDNRSPHECELLIQIVRSLLENLF